MNNEYERKKPAIDICELDQDFQVVLHDSCKWCGRMAHTRIRGELCECDGCYEVTQRLADFIRTGGEAAREFVRSKLDCS